MEECRKPLGLLRSKDKHVLRIEIMNFFNFNKKEDIIFTASCVKWSPDIVDNDHKYGSLRSPVMIDSSELNNVSIYSFLCVMITLSYVIFVDNYFLF